MSIRNYDEWTIDRWRLEPRLTGLEMDDPPGVDPAPPIWKDHLTLAAVVVALGLWLAAATMLR